MADSSLYADLFGATSSGADAADIDAFKKTVSGNDYYRMAAAPIYGAKFNTSTWSPGETFATSLAQAFLGSALNAYGAHDEAQQLQAVAKVLPQLYSDPLNTAAPEGVDPEAFQGLKVSALTKKAVQDAAMKSDLFKAVFGSKLGTDAAIEQEKAIAPIRLENAIKEKEAELNLLKQQYGGLGDIANLPQGLQDDALKQVSQKEQTSKILSSVDALFDKAKQTSSLSAALPATTAANDMAGIGVALTNAIQSIQGREINEPFRKQLEQALPDWNDTKDQIDAKRKIFKDMLATISPSTPLAVASNEVSQTAPTVPPGMKLQKNKITGETRLVPQ